MPLIQEAPLAYHGYEAASLGEAMRMCPYLGSLSIQEAEKAVDDLADIMQLGIDALLEESAETATLDPIGPPEHSEMPKSEVESTQLPATRTEATATIRDTEVMPPQYDEAVNLSATVQEPTPAVLNPEIITPLPESIPVFSDKDKEISVPLVDFESAPRLALQAAQSAAAELQRLNVPEFVVNPSPSESSELPAAGAQEAGDSLAEIASEGHEPMSEFNLTEIGEASEGAAVSMHETSIPLAEADPPAVIFDRFIEALNLVVTTETIQTSVGEATQESTAEHPPLEPPIAAVATEVAAKLAEITPQQKEIAMPIVQNITESVQAIRRLQHAETATPKEIVAAVEQIREQIVQLFEAVGIEYDDQKIEHFVRAMLAPNFVVRQQVFLTPEELAKMGTREFKLADQFSAFLSHSADSDEPPTSHRLGRLVVFITHPSLALQLWARPTPLP